MKDNNKTLYSTEVLGIDILSSFKKSESSSVLVVQTNYISIKNEK